MDTSLCDEYRKNEKKSAAFRDVSNPLPPDPPMAREASCILLCLAGAANGPLDLTRVATHFAFVRKDRRFGGRLCIALTGATVWIYASGKVIALGRNVGEVEAAYRIVGRRLEESGDAAHVGDAVPWNVVRKVETYPRERLSLRKVSGCIPGGRFERAQRAVMCHLKHGINQEAGHSLVQIYGSGKFLVRGRHKGPLPEAIRNLIPTIEGAL